MIFSELSPPEIRWLGRMSYAEALSLQEDILQGIRAGTHPEVLLLLEHEPVYTIGRTRDRSSLGNGASLPHPVMEINRGGQATYHGPGQLVGYPLLSLARFNRDLHHYLRFIEDYLISLAGAFGVAASRREGLTGTWVEDRKLASIGVGVRHWISMHGFAINVEPRSIDGFLSITPCGIGGVRMTDLSTESARRLDVAGVADVAGKLFLKAVPGSCLEDAPKH
jgi:lipoyl(octanoyl) transferase